MVAHASVWIPRAGAPSFPSLSGDVVTDVVVVGAGISGLTTAVLLQRAGHDVVVVDMHGVATGTTGHTTGKVTSQHGLSYARLVAEHGEETARTVRRSQRGRRGDGRRVGRRGIADCDLTRAPAYVYTTDRRSVDEIEREASVAARLGLPAVLADPAEVPFEHVAGRGAVSTTSCTLTPIATALALATSIVDGGGAVHEHTRATRVRERSDHVVVETDHGIDPRRPRGDRHAVAVRRLGWLLRPGAGEPCLRSRRTTPEPGADGDVHHRRAAHPLGTAVARRRTRRPHRRRRGARDRQRSRHGGPLPAPRGVGPDDVRRRVDRATRGQPRTTPPSTTSPMSAVNRCGGGRGSPPAIASGG